MSKEPKICILSGLKIPKGKQNREHYCPKSRVPKYIWDNPYNVHPAHKMLNTIKGSLMPCEWEDKKWNLTYHAVQCWKMKDEDREFLQQTLQNWEKYKINPCEICLMKCKRQLTR